MRRFLLVKVLTWHQDDVVLRTRLAIHSKNIEMISEAMLFYATQVHRFDDAAPTVRVSCLFVSGHCGSIYICDSKRGLAALSTWTLHRKGLHAISRNTITRTPQRNARLLQLVTDWTPDEILTRTMRTSLNFFCKYDGYLGKITHAIVSIATTSFLVNS